MLDSINVSGECGYIFGSVAGVQEWINISTLYDLRQVALIKHHVGLLGGCFSNTFFSLSLEYHFPRNHYKYRYLKYCRVFSKTYSNKYVFPVEVIGLYTNVPGT